MVENSRNHWKLIWRYSVRYGQDKKMNRENGNFVKTNAWQPLFRKMKTIY